MKQVNIADLKTHLSSHLKQVQQGQEILILDRKQPIAKVIPLADKKRHLSIVRKHKTKGGLKKLKFKGIKAKVDVVKALREDRDRR